MNIHRAHAPLVFRANRSSSLLSLASSQRKHDNRVTIKRDGYEETRGRVYSKCNSLRERERERERDAYGDGTFSLLVSTCELFVTARRFYFQISLRIADTLAKCRPIIPRARWVSYEFVMRPRYLAVINRREGSAGTMPLFGEWFEADIDIINNDGRDRKSSRSRRWRGERDR